MLLEETVVGTTSSGTSETISLPNGASVSLNGNYIKEDGTEYSGSVSVIMHHLDPADENMQNQMPGMLYAANSENEERMLQTFGMLAVELRGTNGEDLNLATGSTAEIKVPLDASLIANAPSTIPLWYFDEVNGYWIEDGEATLIGNAYIGTVSHFSFWNCDIPAEAINLCIEIKDFEGKPISDVTICIISDFFGEECSTTNENGIVCGLVPINEVLDIIITCNGSEIYQSNIGPFTEDESISICLDPNYSEFTRNITAVVEDCDGNLVENGYFAINNNNGSKTITPFEDGIVDITIFNCCSDGTLSIEIFDADTLQSTGKLYTLCESNSNNLGILKTCNSIEEFIQFTIDGNHTLITGKHN